MWEEWTRMWGEWRVNGSCVWHKQLSKNGATYAIEWGGNGQQLGQILGLTENMSAFEICTSLFRWEYLKNWTRMWVFLHKNMTRMVREWARIGQQLGGIGGNFQRYWVVKKDVIFGQEYGQNGPTIRGKWGRIEELSTVKIGKKNASYFCTRIWRDWCENGPELGNNWGRMGKNWVVYWGKDLCFFDEYANSHPS